jgi:hypothetical protein
MKPQIELCSLALNPLSPQPTAQMVRLDDGMMTSFGGTFCIRAPIASDVSCVVNPKLLLNFFQKKKRGTVAFTVKAKRLVLKEGKEQLTIPCLPADELETVDVFGPDFKVEGGLNLVALKHAVATVNAQNDRIMATGVTFRRGMMEASDNYRLLAAASGLTDDFDFNLPKESAVALLKFKSKVVSARQDTSNVRFDFEDGSSLVSRLISERLNDLSHFYKLKWVKVKILEDVLDYLSSIECDVVRVFEGKVYYESEGSMGVIEGSAKGPDFKLFKKNFDSLLRLSKSLFVSEEGNLVMTSTDDARMISSTRR